MSAHQEKPRVVIAIPLYTSLIYWQTVAAILALERPFQTDLMVFQGGLVDRARNRLVEQMLDHPMKPTHLFFLDNDVVPAPDTLLRLLKANQPIVSGVYRRRVPPHEPMVFLNKRGIFQPISLKSKNKLVTADYVGGGCLLIERKVLEKLKPPWFVIEWRGKNQLSEDFYFCEKA